MTGEQLKEQIEAFAPLLISILTLTNTFLSMKGMPCIQIDNATITQAVSAAATIVSVVWAWWRNNNVTEKAKISQEVLYGMKTGIVSDDEVLNFLNDQIQGAPIEDVPVEEEVKEAVQRSEDIDGQV